MNNLEKKIFSNHSFISTCQYNIRPLRSIKEEISNDCYLTITHSAPEYVYIKPKKEATGVILTHDGVIVGDEMEHIVRFFDMHMELLYGAISFLYEEDSILECLEYYPIEDVEKEDMLPSCSLSSRFDALEELMLPIPYRIKFTHSEFDDVINWLADNYLDGLVYITPANSKTYFGNHLVIEEYL